MKAVILAGGFGTRISEESHLKPKPMIEIGNMPIIWHIMKIYSFYGINEFIICCGYKGYVLKEYFANYFLHASDVTFDLSNNKMEVHQNFAEPWKITLIDTGLKTMTGGRLKRVRPYLSDEAFCMTYGDGVSNVNIKQMIEFHKTQGSQATLLAIQPSGRFGALEISGNLITSFREKPKGDGAWINGGFFVLEPSVLDLIENDDTVWEQAPLEHLSLSAQLSVYKYHGFWQAMDTLRDKQHLEELWTSGAAPWKVWNS